MVIRRIMTDVLVLSSVVQSLEKMRFGSRDSSTRVQLCVAQRVEHSRVGMARRKLFYGLCQQTCTNYRTASLFA